MKISHSSFLIIFFVFWTYLGIGISNIQALPPSHPTYGDSFRFTENRQQWNSNVLFRAEIPNGYLFLQKNGFQYTFYDGEALRQKHHPHSKKAKQFGAHNRFARTENFSPLENDEIRAHGVKVSLVGSNEDFEVHTEEMGKERKNYFLGNDFQKHAQNVRSFGKVHFQEIYPNMDMVFYTQERHLKYDFVVRKGANPAQIQLKYEHASAVFLRDGNLIIQTSINEFMEQKPYCYQMIDDKKVEVKAHFILKDNILSFEFPQGYDKNYALIIDPTLVFATFSGAASDNWGFTATFDEDENTYTGGVVFGTDFPTTAGAFNVNFNALLDVVIHKYNEDGTQLLYGTFLGGGNAEMPHSLIVDKDNRLVIMGSTGSSNFPITLGAFQSDFQGGNSIFTGLSIDYFNGVDIFTAVLNSTGSKLEAATYLGGTGTDGIMAVQSDPLVFNYGDQARGDVGTDSQGNIYIVSSTYSTDFPVQNAMQSRLAGKQDAVLVKLSADLQTMIWGTYFGGSEHDAGFSMSITESDEVYITGSTTSRNLQISSTALRRTPQGREGFILRVDENGSYLNSTYLGTSNFDMSYLIDNDTEGNVYVFGITFGNYPVQSSTLSNVGRGQFIHKISPNLRQTLYSTRFGSSNLSHFDKPNLSPTALKVSECGHVYLSGWGGHTNNNTGYAGFDMGGQSTLGLSVTSDALRKVSDGSDFYVMILDENASNLLYGSYLGGYNLDNTEFADHDHVDGGTSRFSKDGTIYQAVCACRANPMPTTSGVWANVNRAAENNGCNMYALKFDINEMRTRFTPLNKRDVETREGCSPLYIKFDNHTINADRYLWTFGQMGTSTEFEPELTFTSSGVYPVTLTAFNEDLCISKVIKDTIRVFGNPYGVTPDTVICKGESLQLEATGGERYLWNPSTYLSNRRIANPITTPSITTTYEVQIVTNEGCVYDTTVTVGVSEPIDLDFKTIYKEICPASPIIGFENRSLNANTYLWDFGNGETFEGKNPPDVTYEEGKYIIELRAKSEFCEVSDTFHIEIVSDGVLANFEPKLTHLCEDYPTVHLTNLSKNADTYFWDFGNGRTFQGENPPDFKYNQEGDFIITLTSKNPDCEDFEKDTVTIQAELVSEFMANIRVSENQFICETDPIQLEAYGGTRYEWTPIETLNDPNIPNPIANPKVTTDYNVTIYSPRGCGVDTTIRIEVSPEIQLDFGVASTLKCGEKANLTFENNSTNADAFTWDMGNGETFEGQNPPASFIYEKSGIYTVTLEAHNKACSARQELAVAVSNVIPPNVITPNGDGKNDVFDIGVLESGWKLKIYDRWGKEVYQSDSYQNDWGNSASNTMYFYRLTSPSDETCTGWLQIFK